MQLDERYKALLTELQRDCKQSATKLSRKLGIPPTTIYHMMDRLEKEGVIRKYIALVDQEKVGKPYTCIIFVKCGSELKFEELYNFLKNEPDVQKVYAIQGTEWDIMVKLITSDSRKAGELAMERLRNLKGIGSTQTVTVFKKFKYTDDINVY